MERYVARPSEGDKDWIALNHFWRARENVKGVRTGKLDLGCRERMMHPGKDGQLSLQRHIVVLLVALAVATAPLGAAVAGTRLAEHGATDLSAATPARSDMSGMADMADCEKMMGKSGSADCRCCDPQKACPPEACLAKCYKVFGDLPRPLLARLFVAQRFDAAEPDRPPKRSIRPDTPPPRT